MERNSLKLQIEEKPEVKLQAKTMSRRPISLYYAVLGGVPSFFAGVHSTAADLQLV
jgi:hypothetical protein